MMCFRDFTFCKFHDDCNDGKECGRALTPEIMEEAKKWWNGDDAPICMYTDRPECFVKK